MPLSPPPRDENGAVTPHDHQGILDSHIVIRRVSSQWVVTDPKAPGGRRLSTAVFEPSSPENGGGLSVDLANEIVAAGLDVETYVTTPRWIASVQLTASNLRSKQLMVGYSPIEESNDMPSNPYHGEAWGRIPKGQRKALLDVSQWLVPIANCAVSST